MSDPTPPSSSPARAEDVAARLAEIQQRADAATPGKWLVAWDSCDCGNGMGCDHGAFIEGIKVADGKLILEVNYAGNLDLEFIAHARQDIPWLLQQLAAQDARHQSAMASAVRAERERCAAIAEDELVDQMNSTPSNEAMRGTRVARYIKRRIMEEPYVQSQDHRIPPASSSLAGGGA